MGPFLNQLLQNVGKEGLHELLVKAFKAVFMHSEGELTAAKEHEIAQSAHAIVEAASSPPEATVPVAQVSALETQPKVMPKPVAHARKSPGLKKFATKSAKKTAPKRAAVKKAAKKAAKKAVGKSASVKISAKKATKAAAGKRKTKASTAPARSKSPAQQTK